ncbi:MAG: diguanylate cyclase [Calditrichales bacterium]|nr:MAG: diguanylate cyclase [Calditrichales bacterium]
MVLNVSKSMIDCIKETIDILDDINAMQNIERTLHNIVKSLTDNLSCKTCAVIRLNPVTENLEILNSFGLSWQFCKQYRERVISQAVHDLIWSHQPVAISDTLKNKALAEELKLEKEFASCYCIGLTGDHLPLGYLYLDSDKPGQFTPDAELLIQMYARIISLAILKDRLQEEVKRESTKDPETGVIRYSRFYGQLQEAVSRAQRLEGKMSIILLDVVKYNTIVTAHGFETGKKLMCELVQTVRQVIRDYDGLSKFGVDKLIISLPGHSTAQAFECTQKLYKKITDATFTDHQLKIDVSIGVAGYPDNAGDLNGLLIATKYSLAEAKRHPHLRIYRSEMFF